MSAIKDRVRSRARSFLGHEEASARLDRHLARIEEAERELARVAPQLAALEARFETLRQRVERVERLPIGPLRLSGSGPAELPTELPAQLPTEEVRSIQEELARQQEQVRARISAAARFEERLRRVEDALGPSR